MAIPVQYQQFKAAGIYRLVYDKSTVLGVDSTILRLVVGYSEKGPFNIPTYVTSVSDFKAIYGDISKKLEKRGIYFHRMALQALTSGPILCLNLKKFNGETVDGATINTQFNPKFTPIDDAKLYVEQIYDTTRFWELSADKLVGLKTVEGTKLDQYINIVTTNTKKTSATYFIRKANGSKVSAYNITVNDWYSDSYLPEYLEGYKNSLVSDFFAEIYVFNGKFTVDQVLASNSLKNYFNVEVINGEKTLKLKDHITNAFGENVDTLDALYYDETSNALGHYVGTLIPDFKDKNGIYQSLDVVFNNDQSTHNMMMAFNADGLQEGEDINIDLSGKRAIKLEDSKYDGFAGVKLSEIIGGTATTSVLGNTKSPVICDTIEFSNTVLESTQELNIDTKNQTNVKITGNLYVSSKSDENYTVVLTSIGNASSDDVTDILLTFTEDNYEKSLVKLGVGYYESEVVDGELQKVYKDYKNGQGTYFDGVAFDESLEGPNSVITAITRLEVGSSEGEFLDNDGNMKVSVDPVSIVTKSTYVNEETMTNNVYGSSVSLIPVGSWVLNTDFESAVAYTSDEDSALLSIFSVGDCLLANDGETDMDGDGEVDNTDGYYDNVFVQSTGTKVNEDGTVTYYVKFSGTPTNLDGNLIRVDSSINQEIGSMTPKYLEGYTYFNDAPNGTGMKAKLDWQQFILSTLTDYKGLRTALLNKSEIDYRYIVDTFESFPESGCKHVLSFLAKEKQSAFAILNFPSIRTFVKCPYSAYTDHNGVFNAQYIVDGFNKKKASSVRFSLPGEGDGASFCAFYTPLKFSDGYVDTIVPSAALVSNLFMEKYISRQPYYIIAGPNYGSITASGMVGPDYKYSQEELNILEPYGVNCMVYRPSFGTFINANQTAKQTPKSALSSVNVRELVIYLQDEIEKVLQAYQWEFNNATTRTAILDKANSICARVQSNGGIQAYLNVMDESNNTPDIIDNEMAVLSTHIEPGRGCGKMIQELTIYRTGQMASSISE